MKKHNYKAGDKVRVIGNKCRHTPDRRFHGFDIGDVVTVEALDHDGDIYCRRDSDERSYIVYPEHVELVEPAIFDRDDIKAGYLLEVKAYGTGVTFYMTVVPTNTEEPNNLGCCCPGEYWWSLYNFNEDTLAYLGHTIQRVYGPVANKYLLDNKPEGRKLLWERQEEPKVVEMTVAEISEKLGYEVKIVKEKTN